MSWFDRANDHGLLPVLDGYIRAAREGMVDVVSRSGGGQVYFARGEVLYARTDDEVPLTVTLLTSGATTADGLRELHRTSRLPGHGDREVPLIVSTVVRDLTESALEVLLGLEFGSARVEQGQTPPLGALMSAPLQELAEGAAMVAIRSRALAVRRPSAWQATFSGARPVLTTFEWRLVAAMTVPTTVAQLAEATESTEDLVRETLNGLADRGLAERPPHDKPAPPLVKAAPKPATPTETPTAKLRRPRLRHRGAGTGT